MPQWCTAWYMVLRSNNYLFDHCLSMWLRYNAYSNNLLTPKVTLATTGQIKTAKFFNATRLQLIQLKFCISPGVIETM